MKARNETQKEAPKRKSTACMLDIKQLLKLDTNINYFSLCPACGLQVSEHKDTDFLRDQIAERTAAEDDLMGAVMDETAQDGSILPPKKKVKLPVPAAEAVDLIRRVRIVAAINMLSYICTLH